MNKKLLTVVVPVFNGEGYIINILRDLHCQTFGPVEFLIVDDGSVDGTANIIEKFISDSSDERFTYLHQSNSGVSAARNLGIHSANGEYILFIDGDDSIDSDICSAYYREIFRNQTDIEFFPFQTVQKTTAISRENSSFILTKKQLNYGKYSSRHILNSENILKLVFDFKIQGYPFGYISKTSLWKKINFDTEVSLAEDLFALIQILLEKKSLKIHINKTGKYRYVMREDSVLHSTLDSVKNKNLEKLFKKIIIQCKNKGYDEKHVSNLLYGHYFSLLMNAVKNGDIQYSLKLKRILWRKLCFIKMPFLSRMKRWTVLLFCTSPNLYIYRYLLKLNSKVD